MPFTDVDQFNSFYIYIKCLYCRGIISGYSSNCPTGAPCFKPYNDITRGQIAKIVSNSAGFSEPVSGQYYTDVPPSHTFYVWIMRLTLRGHMGGYNDAVNCAGVGIPCFRPERPATRGQLSKIVSNAAGFDEPPVGQSFADVLPSNPFYAYIQRLSRRGVISGYDCGTNYINPCTLQVETCDGQNRPYFRWCALVTRGQASKIVSNTFFPLNCMPGLPPLDDTQQ
jgi:hypothetical protein